MWPVEDLQRVDPASSLSSTTGSDTRAVLLYTGQSDQLDKAGELFKLLIVTFSEDWPTCTLPCTGVRLKLISMVFISEVHTTMAG